MKWNKLAITGTLGAIALLSLAGCPGQKKAGGPPPGANQPAPVHAAAAETNRVPVELAAFGTAEPLSTIELKAQVSGEIIEVLFAEGERVTQGQPLFRIDPRPFEAALAEAEANVARAVALRGQAEANLRENEVMAKNADMDLERNKTLLAREIVTQEEFDQSKTAADALKASAGADAAAVRSSSENIRAAEASVAVAKLNLSYCTIASPLEGRTGSLMAHRGNLVSANASEPLVIITQTAPMYVTFTVPEHHLPALRQAMVAGEVPVYATAPDSAMEPITGRLVFIDNQVDTATSTIRLKAEFENHDEVLWPGQYLSIRVGLGFKDNCTTVPAEAVQTGQNGAYVYLVTSEDKAEMRPIKVGITHGGLAVVDEGLQPGDRVITEGHLRVAPGSPVRVLEGDQPVETPAG
jgi:multidrug efflux system membrane fusion protein